MPEKVGGVRLGRLAVARQFQGQGIGKELLIATMYRFLEIFQLIGGVGIFVDAKDERAVHFYDHFGFLPFKDSPLKLFLPAGTISDFLTERSE